MTVFLKDEPMAIDIPKTHWLQYIIPKKIYPFIQLMRLDRPIGAWLLLFPCWWGLALAGNAFSFKNYLLFALGTFVMRGAGCTYNDWVDRKLDAKVLRTSTRPLAAGTLTSSQALLALMFQLFFAFLILMILSLRALPFAVAALGLITFYPWAKRFTYWPQVFLGLTFNWGALMAWFVEKETLDLDTVLLYGAGFFWTLGYDTIYAHQDKEDDLLIGIKSTALRLKEKTRFFLGIVYGLVVALFVVIGLRFSFSALYFLFILGVSGHFLWQGVSTNFDNPSDCLKKFKANQWVGWLILLAIVLEKIWMA
jgi:4-hydroxybenzoate polyprenyltransferase